MNKPAKTIVPKAVATRTDAVKTKVDVGSLPVTALKGVGSRVAEKLTTLGLETLEDLAFHLPSRYQDRTRVVPIGSLRVGTYAQVVATIDSTQVRFGRRRSLLTVVDDGSGMLTLRFFHFSRPQQLALATGRRILCYGEVRKGPHGFELIHPEYQLIAEDEPVPVADRLTAIYPTTEGLGQHSIRKLVDQALDLFREQGGLSDYLPARLRERLRLPELTEAVELAHHPTPDISAGEIELNRRPERRRLAFEELLAHHLSLREVRNVMHRHAAPILKADSPLVRNFTASLAFSLTSAQGRVADEITADLETAKPMHRLVQGDVGSGKTVVAALAALSAIHSGYQVALMAPTELLAEQHKQSFTAWFAPLSIEVAWLSGKLKAKPRREALQQIADGTAAMVVGTHALFQDAVQYARLGLVIVDEQHRFGVHQRLALRTKGVPQAVWPHQLVLTATPIPRTLAMTAYADLDTSSIDELPPGRQPVGTAVIAENRRPDVIARVRLACESGRQAYWVCPIIEESEVLEAEAASDTAERLTTSLPTLRVGLIHGRLKAAEKEQIMASFKAHELDVLVATTVIEVGVDVPNASLMIIENAERLGLAQLHQLRGRVGRGSVSSACVLMYRGPLSRTARARLTALRETTDGFVLAEKDLELRGPGELLGTKQTGLARLRIANLNGDRDLLEFVEQAAEELFDVAPDNVALIVRRWLGTAAQYIEA